MEEAKVVVGKAGAAKVPAGSVSEVEGAVRGVGA